MTDKDEQNKPRKNRQLNAQEEKHKVIKNVPLKLGKQEMIEDKEDVEFDFHLFKIISFALVSHLPSLQGRIPQSLSIESPSE